MRTKFSGAKFFDPATSSFRDSLVIEDGKVAAIDKFDEEINFGGGFAFPAFRDGHCHPLFAGREADGPNVTSAKSVEEIVAIVREYRKKNPQINWIEGGAYDRSLVADGRFRAVWLDEATTEVPIVLHASDHHTIWVNSAALSLLPNLLPTLRAGSVDQENGAPLGVLREPEAMDLVLIHKPPRSLEQEVASLVWADRLLASFGIVQAQDAWITQGMTEVYIEAAKSKQLLLDYNLGFKIDPSNWQQGLASAIEARQLVLNEPSKKLNANTAKFFADGVFGSGTAAVIEPYLDDPNSFGEPLWKSDQLNLATLEAAKLGFQLHIHAIGDAGIRQALDAIEHVQHHHGATKLPSVIAHVELVSDQDLTRFAKLGVVANMQPLWAQADGMLLSCEPRLGKERLDAMYRMRDLKQTGARIAFGSDWPVSSANPLSGIATAISREDEHGNPPGGWVIEQALSIEEALKAYSSEVYFQLWGAEQPPLQVGSEADFFIVDENLLEIPAKRLREIRIQSTFKSGIQIF
ncbi:MAG: amidohydrolase [Actinomycetota bacterium]